MQVGTLLVLLVVILVPALARTNVESQRSYIPQRNQASFRLPYKSKKYARQQGLIFEPNSVAGGVYKNAVTHNPATLNYYSQQPNKNALTHTDRSSRFKNYMVVFNLKPNRYPNRKKHKQRITIKRVHQKINIKMASKGGGKKNKNYRKPTRYADTLRQKLKEPEYNYYIVGFKDGMFPIHLLNNPTDSGYRAPSQYAQAVQPVKKTTRRKPSKKYAPSQYAQSVQPLKKTTRRKPSKKYATTTTTTTTPEPDLFYDQIYDRLQTKTTKHKYYNSPAMESMQPSKIHSNSPEKQSGEQFYLNFPGSNYIQYLRNSQKSDILSENPEEKRSNSKNDIEKLQGITENENTMTQTKNVKQKAASLDKKLSRALDNYDGSFEDSSSREDTATEDSSSHEDTTITADDPDLDVVDSAFSSNEIESSAAAANQSDENTVFTDFSGSDQWFANSQEQSENNDAHSSEETK